MARKQNYCMHEKRRHEKIWRHAEIQIEAPKKISGVKQQKPAGT